MSKKLSVTIITFNEEKNIQRCLDSVVSVADEIIVVDSFSTDKTQEICQSYQVTFVPHKFQGHIEQKNKALELASFDHVLSLDADEALSEELQKKILEEKEKGFPSKGYQFNRLTHYVDQWITHCGWYPDVKLRLVEKKGARWSGVNPHDFLTLDSAEIKHLKGQLLHYSYNSISEHVNQTNKFTTIAAQAAFDRGVRSSVFKIVTRPLLKFLRDYFYKLGFLDGRYGFIICCINSLSALLKYSKIYDLQRGKSIS